MQSRQAIILSVGMLLEKVDSSPFIDFILSKATLKTPEKIKEAFGLSDSLNDGTIPFAIFRATVLKLLGIEQIEDAEFDAKWNEMVTVGQMNEKIKLLDQISKEKNALIYLASDTNSAHFEKIRAAALEEKIDCSTTSLSRYPLCLSFQTGDRLAVIRKIVADIRSKEFNKPEMITVVLGDPENIKDKNHRAKETLNFNEIEHWCLKNNVLVQKQKASLEETFELNTEVAPALHLAPT